jgi:hypothetical protein
MKNFNFLPIALFFFLGSIAHAQSAIDIGIMDIFDTELKLNHNQAFKKFLSRNDIRIGGKTASISLVEHQSGSKLAINSVMGNNRVITTVYKDGKILKKDTFRVTSIEKKVENHKLKFELIQTPAGVTIISADSSYIRNFRGDQKGKIQIGHVIQNINDTPVGNDLSAAEKLLVYQSSKIVPIVLLDPATGKSERFFLPTILNKTALWTYPLDEVSISLIFTGIYANLKSMQSDTEMLMGPVSENALKDLLKARNSEGKCKAQEQFTIYYDPKTHPVCVTTQKNTGQPQLATSASRRDKPESAVTVSQLAAVEFSNSASPTDKPESAVAGTKVSSTPLSSSEIIGSVFKREMFYYPKGKSDSKNWEAGDAALWVIQYYNYDQNESHMIKHSSVDDNLKKAIEKMSGPYYNKPGVWANYLAAGVDYETNKNYGAALNQYYASLRKIDDIICSELTKVRAKKIALERIAFCSEKLGQTNYAGLMKLASECLKTLDVSNSDLSKGHDNFYKVADELQAVCVSVEQKLKEQRSERALSIVNAVASGAAGVASLSYDAVLATSLIINAVDIMDQNAQFNAQTNMVLAETTNSISINLPAELENEERSPYEVMATSYINYALTHSSNPYEILKKISDNAKENSALKNAAEKVKSSWRETGKINQTDLINELLRTEIIFYRYEKRGLSVPETARP